MAKQAKEKKARTVVTDKDHPSLIEVGGKIRLRVLEDFNIETELPKWKRFKKEWEAVKSDLHIAGHDYSDEELRERIQREMPDKTDSEREAEFSRVKALMAMDKAVRDDRWNIRGKHEREVNEAVLKQARYVRELTWVDRLKNALNFGKRKILPVHVAMGDLLQHIELTSTPELEVRLAHILSIEEWMRTAGQYKRADSVKALRTILVEEAAVCAAGFTEYVTEETMIDFLRKSERGTVVDFLRYYEDEIPPEVIERKLAADKLMVFDNYVVAHYSDMIQKAAAVAETASAEAEQREREKRRDPILFGLIKNSRKLYYICDWKTETDDLTLEKLEKELGVTRGSLVDGAGTQLSTYVGIDPAEDGTATSDNMRQVVLDLQRRVAEQEFLSYTRNNMTARFWEN